MTELKPAETTAQIAARLERVLREARKDEERLKQILKAKRLKRRIRILTAANSK